MQRAARALIDRIMHWLPLEVKFGVGVLMLLSGGALWGTYATFPACSSAGGETLCSVPNMGLWGLGLVFSGTMTTAWYSYRLLAAILSIRS